MVLQYWNVHATDQWNCDCSPYVTGMVVHFEPTLLVDMVHKLQIVYGHPAADCSPSSFGGLVTTMLVVVHVHLQVELLNNILDVLEKGVLLKLFEDFLLS